MQHPSVTQANTWITTARLAPFMSTSDVDRATGIRLYIWNARLASACFEVIHHVEVLIRNSIHATLTSLEPDDGIYSWLVDPSVLKPEELRVVQETIARIPKRARPVTASGVVGSLSFGFWPRLTTAAYDELWKSALHLAFPHSSGSRSDVAGRLNRVAQLRNDIAHHKAILSLPLADRHRDLIELATFVDPAAGDWIAAMSSVPAMLSRVATTRRP